MSEAHQQRPNLARPVRFPFRALAMRVFLVFLVLYVGLTRGHFWSVDEVAVYHQTRSLWQRGNLVTAPLLNAVTGRDAQSYSALGAGQSVLAVPLFCLGKLTRHILEKLDADDAIRTLAGPVIGESPGNLWGGEVEIWFVDLFNAFAVAGICSVFFAFSWRLGATPHWALVAALLLGTTSYVAGTSNNFFQHSAESLFILWSFYFLLCDTQNPGWRPRLWAGLAAGVMTFVRITAALALPVLAMYLLWGVWNRRNRAWSFDRFALHAFAECLPFAAPAAAGLFAVAAVNYWKFGAFDLVGGFVHFQKFDASLWVSLYAYLFSPGGSIFVFTPLLVLAPWYFRKFVSQNRSEALVVFSISLAYAIFCGKVTGWHSQWSFGIRHLTPVVALLLLPLAGWLQSSSKWKWGGTAVLGLAGMWVQLLQLLVNTSYVYHYEKYLTLHPPHSYIFVPAISQVAAHGKALLAWDFRVDFWLLNIYRIAGVDAFLLVAGSLLCLLYLSFRKMLAALQQANRVLRQENCAGELEPVGKE